MPKWRIYRMQENIDGVYVVSSEDMEAIRVFLAELEYMYGDLLSVPWMVA